MTIVALDSQAGARREASRYALAIVASRTRIAGNTLAGISYGDALHSAFFLFSTGIRLGLARIRNALAFGADFVGPTDRATAGIASIADRGIDGCISTSSIHTAGWCARVATGHQGKKKKE